MKRTEKEQELFEYLERINQIMWDYIIPNSCKGDKNNVAHSDIMEVLEEWADNN